MTDKIRNRLINAGVFTALAAFIVLIILSYLSIRLVAKYYNWEVNSMFAIQKCDRILSALYDAEAGEREFVITGDEKSLVPYMNAARQEPELIGELNRLTANSPLQQKKIDNLEYMIGQNLAQMKTIIELRRTQGFDAASRMVMTDMDGILLDSLRIQVKNVREEECRVFDKVKNTKNTYAHYLNTSLIIGAIISFFLILCIFLLLKSEIKRRIRIERELRLYQKHLDSLVEKRTRELQESELRLNRMYESGMLGVVYWNAEGAITSANNKFLEMLGYNQEDLASGSINMRNSTPQEYRKKDEIALTELRTSGICTPYEKEYLRKDGTRIQVIGGCAVLKKEPLSAITFLLDISERKKAEAALIESERRLKLLNESLESLVVQRTEQVRSLSKELTIAEQRERQRFSMILHDDLQQILFSAKMLLDSVDCRRPEDLEENRQIVHDAGKMLQKAIETTKSVAVELNPPVLRNEGLDAALIWLAHHMEERYGLRIHSDISGVLSAVRGIDQILIIQLARELLYNIVKHAKTKEAAISGIREGNTIRVSIEDKGTGFDLEKIGNRGDLAGKMGLFSIRERLKLFGGHLDIQSQPGTGTKVVISIPVTG